MGKLMQARFWRDPFFVMGVVLVMYAFKVFGKIVVGEMIHSPVISGDGFHNISDLFEAMAVMLVVYLARRSPNAEYPFGLKQIEYLTSLVIGAALTVVAFNFFVDSFVGLLAQVPAADAAVRQIIPALPPFNPLVMSTDALPWILIVTGGSALLSLFVSRYQIAVGKATGHQSLIADGSETWSDGRIELVVLAGVLCEYLFHAAWLEYPLGIYVSYLVVHTAWSLIKTGWSALLLRTIGKEHEDEITRICLATAGVVAVESLKTFRVGHSAVCMLTVRVRGQFAKSEHIKYALENAITGHLEEEDFKGVELQLKFVGPDPERHRIALAVVAFEGQPILADTLEQCSHLLVCDMENGAVVRTKLVEKGEDPIAILLRKRVRSIYLYQPTEACVKLAGLIEVTTAPTYSLSALGVKSVV